MGMTAFELFGVLKLDRSDFDKDLNSAEKSAKGFGSSLTGSMVKADLIASGLKAAGKAAIDFAQGSMGAATSFESAFTGVRKTVDATEEEYGQLSDWIMDASTKMASSKEDIAATMEIAGQLGVRGVDGLEKFTETMIMLGDTTNLNAEEAASALAKFGNIAGLKSTDMGRIGSAIVDLGNHFATTEADITAMATRLASAGTIAGLSATDILGLSTAMSSVGIQAEAGGTAMAQTMASMTKAVEGALPYLSQPYESLADDEKEAVESLRQYADVSDMTAQEFAETWKNKPIEAIQAFIGGLGEMNEADQSVVMMLDRMGLKGIRQSNMLQALALASDTMTSAVNTANTAFEENVALQNEANTRYGTTESQMLQAAEAFKNLKVAIGQELMPTMQQFAGFSTTAMQDISEGLQKGGLEGMMSSVGVAISDGLRMVTEMLPTVFTAGAQLLGALGQGILDNLPVIIPAAVEIINKLVSGLVSAAPALVNGGMQVLLGLANGIAQMLPTLVPTIVDVVLSIVETLLDNVDLLIDGAIALMIGLADGLINALPILLEKAPVIIEKLLTAIINNAPKLLLASVELITKLVVGIVENLPKLITAAMDIITALKSGIVRMLPQVLTMGRKIVDKVWEGIKSLDPIKWGQDMMDAFIKGIKNRLTKLGEAVKEVGKTIKDFLGFSEPKKGPLSNFHTFAPDMMELFAQGIKDNEDIVADQVAKSFDFTDKIGTISNTPVTFSKQNDIISLLDRIAANQNVTVVLEGDADRLFRVIQRKSVINKEITGQESFA